MLVFVRVLGGPMYRIVSIDGALTLLQSLPVVDRIPPDHQGSHSSIPMGNVITSEDGPVKAVDVVGGVDGHIPGQYLTGQPYR